MNKRYTFLLTVALLNIVFLAQGAIPIGYYYFARGKKNAELKTKLHVISAPLTVLNYGSGEGFTWQGFYKTDRNADNSVADMYSNTLRYFDGFKAIPEMNIEHSLPKSWWGGHENYAYKDLFHLYPSDAQANSIKNNWPLGEVTGTPMFDNGKSRVGKNGFGTDYFDTCFEPANEYKGDFARSYFYVATIYEDLANLWNSPMMTNTTYPVWKPWAVNLLMKWHQEDPVSQKERDRNDSIYTIQGNRNPFIDHPELAQYIWGNKTEEAFTYPEETGAFLIAPRRMYQVDLGVILQNVTKSVNLTLQGVNITQPLTLSLTGNSVALSLSTSTVSVADAQAGYMLQITYSPTETGGLRDTLLISGGGLTENTRIPIRALSSSEFLTMPPTDVTPVRGTLHWLEEPQAVDYKVSLYQGDTRAGDLIISGYLEGLSNDKAIELYNGTGSPIDLSNYTLRRQTNGMGDYSVTQKLSGILPNNKSYLIVYSKSSNTELRAKADMFDDDLGNTGGSVCAFNGNDAVALFRNGIEVDIVGKKDGGADYYWGQDKMLKRKADITHPVIQFNLADWAEYSYGELNRLGNHAMNFVANVNYIFQDKSVGNVDNLVVDNLLPNSTYTYSVTSLFADASSKTAANTVQLRTSVLEAPVALDASDITGNSFSANWEENPYAAGYYLDVYKLQGQKVKETEEFNDVGGNGKPLPTGWTGTASGNYTSNASSGKSPNSIALKNSDEWLQSPTQPDVIAELNFMYRFASSSPGSSLKIEAKNADGWTVIDNIVYSNTTKTYPTYTFPASKKYNAIRFTYNKVGSGNLALDDVMIEHGHVDTLYMMQNQYVTGSQYEITGLEKSTAYYYRLRGNLNTSSSSYSGQIAVTTLNATSVQNLNSQSYKIVPRSGGVAIQGLSGGEMIRCYSVTGGLITVQKAQSSFQFIPLSVHGVYVLQINNGARVETYKVVR